MLIAQEANNWYFGFNSGITFSTDPPTFVSGGQINTYEGCSGISDNAGNLLFYSDGIKVWDRNHNQMPNGYGLLGHQSTTQVLIVPKPGSNAQYYIFTPPYYYFTTPLCYSVVDMSLNGGNGDVTLKNIALLDSSTEKVAAVRHSNGTDIWIAAHTFGNADFHLFLLTASGIGSPVVSTIGSVHTSYFYNKGGYLKFSAAGDKIAAAVVRDNLLEVFDFDKTTGIVTHPIHVGPGGATTNNGFYGVEFSPDGSRLYATKLTPSYLIQFNLLAGSDSAVINSADTIFSLPTGTGLNPFFGGLQAGPDGRIYSLIAYTHHLACITNPNQLGVACSYDTAFVSLDTTSAYIGLPGFMADYFNNLNVGTSMLNIDDINIQLQPNPNNGIFDSHFPIQNISGELLVYDVMGNLVYKDYIAPWSQFKKVGIGQLTDGIYLCKMTWGNKTASVKVVKD